MKQSKDFTNDADLFDSYANLLKALAHPVRLCIVKGLLSNKGCNVTSIYSCLNMPQSTISQHLAKLKSAGIIAGERHGLEITYRVIHPKVPSLITALFSDENKNE